MPERIQLRRTKGWCLPSGAVSVARPTRWGNPFRVDAECLIALEGADGLWHEVSCRLTREQAVEMFRADWATTLDHAARTDLHPKDEAYYRGELEALRGLRGKDLACWCPAGQPCHAEVLLQLANAKR